MKTDEASYIKNASMHMAPSWLIISSQGEGEGGERANTYICKITAPKCHLERQKFIDPNDLRTYAMGTAVHTGMQDIWYVYMHVYLNNIICLSIFNLPESIMVQITQYTRRYGLSWQLVYTYNYFNYCVMLMGWHREKGILKMSSLETVRQG